MKSRLWFVAVAAVAVGWSAAHVTRAHLTSPALLATGLPIALLFLGWTLLRALGLHLPNTFKSLILVVGTSFAELVALGLLLTLGIGLTLNSPLWAIALGGAVSLQALVAAARPEPKQRRARVHIASWAVLLMLLPALGLWCLGAIIAVDSARAVPPPHYTELWATATLAGSLVVDVQNREGEPVPYSIVLRNSGGVLARSGTRTVAPNTTWRPSFQLPASVLRRDATAGPPAGPGPITVDLYRRGEPLPYRWVTVGALP